MDATEHGTEEAAASGGATLLSTEHAGHSHDGHSHSHGEHMHAHDACQHHHHHHHDDDDDDCEDGACSCHHHHGDDDEEGHPLAKIVVAAALFVAALLVEHLAVFSLDGPLARGNQTLFMVMRGVGLGLYCAAYLLCGLPLLREAAENLFRGKVFGEEFLMALATVVAILLGEYSEAVAVMILFQLGEFLEDKAVGASRRSISALVDIRPDVAVVKRGDTEETVPAADVAVGDVVVVRPGERVPLDGIVVRGSALMDTSALTGESVPRPVQEGDEVLSGCVDTSGALEIRVAKPFGESTVSRVLELVEHAQEKKAHAQKFITRFAKAYTPVVCAVALLLAVVPPVLNLVAGNGAGGEVWRGWVYRALKLLVVSCPCALVISVPLSFFAGIGLASRRGILVKGANYIELLSRADTVVFDKTGTLTKGVFAVSDVHVAPGGALSADELLAVATHAEYYSLHPISRSLKEAHQCPECGAADASGVEEIGGHGVKCLLDGRTVLVGNRRLMERGQVVGLAPCEKDDSGTVVHVAVNGQYCGHIIINDAVKDDAAQAVAALRRMGVRRTVMLTGDSESAAMEAARELGITTLYADLLPQDKVSRVEDLLAQGGGKRSVVFVGDGINDAPVLSRSDVGIAMGALGSDAAIEAADVVIMDDRISKLPVALSVARRTMRTVWQNVVFSLGIKLLIMVLCALDVASMWAAVFGDVGVTMLAVLNAMRLLVGTRKEK